MFSTTNESRGTIQPTTGSVAKSIISAGLDLLFPGSRQIYQTSLNREVVARLDQKVPGQPVPKQIRVALHDYLPDPATEPIPPTPTPIRSGTRTFPASAHPSTVPVSVE